MKNSSVFLLFILNIFSLLSQEEKDTTNSKQLEEIHVINTRFSGFQVGSDNIIIDREAIQSLQPNDLGELLNNIPGVQVKSYGGLGGMKTANIRGLNGNHTSLVMDGFEQVNPQTGQSNLANYQLDNIEEVIIQRGGSSEILIPVKAQLSGNAIILKSFSSVSPKNPLQQRLISKFGSWGYMDNQLTMKTGSDKFYGDVLIKYRKATGDYPYKFKNYTTQIEGERRNNDFTDINAGIHFGYKPVENHKFNFFFDYLTANQGVPGPIVLYNDYANQTLSTTSLNFKTDYKGKVFDIDYRLYYSFNGDEIIYVDPNYLNAEGELRSDYKNKVNDLGLTLAYSLKKWFSFNAGTEWINSKLRSKNSFISKPIREQISTFAKATFEHKKVTAIAQIGHQYIEEKNKNGSAADNISKFTPFFEVRYRINEKISFTGYYRNSFRPPSFNELYYNNIGNNNLKPEDAHQFTLSGSYTVFNTNKTYLGFQMAAYYHEINNMILSIPTKNTFIWSIQNVGKNKVQGLEAIISFTKTVREKFSFQTLVNYTYQVSKDYSNPKSPTYKHQIAYSPNHTFNVDFSFLYTHIGTRFTFHACSDRYALNENVPQNIVDGFYTLDWGIFSTIKIDKNNSVKFQINIKNITNVSYAYVKNFVMPGRQFQFSFIYAFI